MSLIHAYGLHWERRFVFWGHPGAPGHLLGSNGRRKDARIEVDFRNQAGVYILYDSVKQPVYVGQAGRKEAPLFYQLKTHLDDNLWNRWAFFSWFGLYSISDEHDLVIPASGYELKATIPDSLDAIEAILIEGLEPSLNRQGAKWKGTKEWWQVKDQRILEPTLRDIMQSISGLNLPHIQT